jgi:hypothetical protein
MSKPNRMLRHPAYASTKVISAVIVTGGTAPGIAPA